MLICCALLLEGCKQSHYITASEEIIMISSDNVISVDLFQYMHDKQIIQLETNDSCFLGRNIDLRISNDKLYVLDNKSIYIFNRKGQFLTKIRHHGRGPYEYVSVSDYQIEGNNISVLDNARSRLITYDKEGRCIESSQLEGYPRAFSYLNDTLLIVAADYYKPDDLFHYYDRRTMSKISSCYPLHTQKLNYLHILGQHNFSIQDEHLVYTEALNSCIFEMEADTIKRRYNFESSRFPSEEFYDTPFEDVMQFMQAFQKRNHAALGGNISVGKRYVFLSYCGYPAARYCLYDKESQESINFKTVRLFERELTDFMIIPLSNGCLALVIPAMEFSDKALGEKSSLRVAESDNPIIILMKIK